MKNFRLRMMIRSLLVFLLCLLTFSLRAANTHFRTLDVKRGLADNFVRDIMTDSEGYVWISTMNGVSRTTDTVFLISNHSNGEVGRATWQWCVRRLTRHSGCLPSAENSLRIDARSRLGRRTVRND